MESIMKKPHLSENVLNLQQRILESTIRNENIDETILNICNSILASGIPLCRSAWATFAVHPLYSAKSFIWDNETNQVQVDAPSREDFNSPGFRNSPFFYMNKNNISFMRARFYNSEKLDVPDFPIFNTFREQNITEYLVFAHHLETKSLTFRSIHSTTESINEGFFTAFSTKFPTGFSESEIQILQALSHSIAVAIKSNTLMELVSTISTHYIGARAGQKVISGEIDRGAVDTIDAAIWFGDLRGFTRMSDTVPAIELIACLNEYLEVVSQPLLVRGGEILKYMGDGVLGIIELGNDPQSRVISFLEAAQEVFKNLDLLTQSRKAEGKIIFEFDLVLHSGKVSYGNIGATDRLDFTVIGSAVNEASRMESLCDKLGYNLLLSKDLVSLIPISLKSIKSLGKHQLRGVNAQKEIFTLEL